MGLTHVPDGGSYYTQRLCLTRSSLAHTHILAEWYSLTAQKLRGVIMIHACTVLHLVYEKKQKKPVSWCAQLSVKDIRL